MWTEATWVVLRHSSAFARVSLRVMRVLWSVEASGSKWCRRRDAARNDTSRNVSATHCTGNSKSAVGTLFRLIFAARVDALLYSAPVLPASSPSALLGLVSLKTFLNDDPSRYSLILGASISAHHHFEWHRWQSLPRWKENRRGLLWRRIRR